MYPSQTSLIPVTVALSKFIEVNGLASMFWDYPYWYMGVPYRYLTGPLTPLLQVFLHKIVPNVSLFSISIYLVLFSFFLAVVGWFLLINKLTDNKIYAYIAALLLLILPWRYLSALALSDGSATISTNVFPFVLLTFWNYYEQKNRKNAVVAVMALSFILLINTSILPIFVVGVSALILSASYRNGKIRKITGKIKSTLLPILISLAVITFWYTPGYWWTVVTNPSIGGASGVKVLIRILDLLKSSVPLILAVIAVYFSGRIKTKLSVFSLTWVFTFLFLTIFRFIGDPDFWMDWTSWFSELEIGVAFLASILVVNILDARNFQTNSRNLIAGSLVIIVLFLVPFYLTWRFYSVLGKPKLISSGIPRGVWSLEKLNEIVNKDEAGLPFRSFTRRRVFLSGSTVFWANALYDIYQVRGGMDEAATNPYWDKAAYELRDGSDPKASRQWLDKLEVSYVLVHGTQSLEYYHDFRNINKWRDVGNIVWEGGGDAIYEVYTKEPE